MENKGIEYSRRISSHVKILLNSPRSTLLYSNLLNKFAGDSDVYKTRKQQEENKWNNVCFLFKKTILW